MSSFPGFKDAVPDGEGGLSLPPDHTVWCRVGIRSFGYLHRNGAVPAPALAPHIVVDLRDLFRDPHADHALRQLTGRHDSVRANVLRQPGAMEFVRAQADTVAALVAGRDLVGDDRTTEVMFGCAGGRHRSVVIAEAVAMVLMQRGIGVSVDHLDILRPLVGRTAVSR
jgi:UPF0042 nucleotide-binding protein